MTTKILFLIFLLFTFFPGFSQSAGKRDITILETELNIILSDLDSVIFTSTNQSRIVADHYNFIRQKINRKELTIRFDSTLTYDFFGCASFGIGVDNPDDFSINFGQFIVDKYRDYPALTYAVLIYTFQLAYDYFNNHELFLISMDNPIEKTYFETDALTIEAMFLNVYMRDAENLGHFEKYLIADLSDNLYGSSILFNRTDLELLHKIDNLKSLDKKASKLLKEFNEIGNDLIKNVTFNSGNDWADYCSVITLRTYVYYSQQVIFDILHLKNGVAADLFTLDDYPEIIKTINLIQKIINDNNRYLGYQTETLKMLGDYYKK